MKACCAKLSPAGGLAVLFGLLALSACAGPGGEELDLTQPAPMPTASPTRVASTATLAQPKLTLTPSGANQTEAASATAAVLEPGFTTTAVLLPDAFPILPEARFVAYNPAFEPCAAGRSACATQAVPEQVWLYELVFPADSEMTGHAVANQYMTLLTRAGYRVEAALSDEATRLTFSGPAGSLVKRGWIDVGPSVRPLPVPLLGRIIGLRITLEQP